MIIWGWRTSASVMGNGEFYCPHCQSRQPYKYEKLRRWFTLYFIPVIPLSTVGEQVTCGRCQTSFVTSVLENDPEKLRAEQLDRIAQDWLAAMAAICASRGGVTPQAAQMIVEDIEAATSRRFAPNKVSEAAAELHGAVSDATIVTRLGGLPNDLSSTGQERFLLSALRVLRTITNCGPAEISLTRTLGASLGVSDSHVKGILLEAGLYAA